LHVPSRSNKHKDHNGRTTRVQKDEKL